MCIDCGDPINGANCQTLLQIIYYFETESILRVEFSFTKPFREIVLLVPSDIYADFQSPPDALFFNPLDFWIAQNKIIAKIEILESFLDKKRILFRVPVDSQIQIFNGLRLNDGATLTLGSLELENIFLPHLSEANQNINRAIDSIEGFINQE